MWTDYITSISHVLKVNEYGERQAKGNEKNLCFTGWETLVRLQFSVHNLNLKVIVKILKRPYK